jgi:hypothetical protein
VFATTTPSPQALQPLLDRQALAMLFAGILLLLISFTTIYSYGDLQYYRSLGIDEQVGVGLHLAAVAALFGDVELATRLRYRAADEAAQEREQATRRARIQARCLFAQCRFLLADTALNRLPLSEALAVLIEEINPPRG